MENSFTGRPWVAVQYPNKQWGVRQADGLGFAICNLVGQDMDPNAPDAVEPSIARLIASAPELLEACKMALEALGTDKVKVWNHINDVVKKAEGKG